MTNTQLKIYEPSVCGKLTKPQVDLVLSIFAGECKSEDEKAAFLAFCTINKVNPIKREAFAIRAQGKMVPCLSHDLMMARAHAAGYLVTGSAVANGDDFGGFDMLTYRPVRHVQKGGTAIAGAWACARDIKSGQFVAGNYWPLAELSNPNSPTHKSMPGHMAKKNAELRVARLVCAELGGAYAPEEFGVDTNETKGAIDASFTVADAEKLAEEGKTAAPPPAEEMTETKRKLLDDAKKLCDDTSKAGGIARAIAKRTLGPDRKMSQLTETELENYLGNVEARLNEEAELDAQATQQ